MSGRILWGDARQALDLVENGSVHLVLTSPPYNAGIEYDEHDDRLPMNEWIDLVAEVVEKSWAKLVPGGRFCLNVQHSVNRQPAEPIGRHAEGILLQQPGALYRGAVVWRQSFSGAGYTSWGSFGSPSNPVLRGEYEMLYVASKDRFDRPDRSGKGDISNYDFTFATRDVWDIPAAHRNNETHPVPFPNELVKRAIQLYTWPGDHVLDPFAGGGTTAVVAQALGRQWTMVELSLAYCEMIVIRAAEWEGHEPEIEEVK